MNESTDRSARKMAVMNRFFICCSVLILLSGIAAPVHARPAKKQFKGVELYSWQDAEGELVFALLPGTNAMKQEDWIKSPDNQIVGLEALEKRFFQLAEAENVYWFEAPPFSIPDEDMVDEVKRAAKKAKVNLFAPKPRELIRKDGLAKSKFERCYAQWLEECRKPEISISSSTHTYTNLPGFRSIVALGRPALPFLQEKMEEDRDFNFMLAYAVLEINGWKHSDFKARNEQELCRQVLQRMESEPLDEPK
jgi:hypothetical protein